MKKTAINMLIPFTAYNQFAKEYLGQDQAAYTNIREFEIDGKQIALLGLNSALMCGRNINRKGVVDDRGHLIVGEPQIHDGLKQIAGTDVRIAVLHHPFDWLDEFDRNIVEGRLSRDCHFILSGHLHMPKVSVAQGTIGDCVTIPAGAIYDKRIPYNPRYTNAYNFVHLDFTSALGRVYLRCWSEQRGVWIEDVDLYKGGLFQFSLPKALGHPPSAIAPSIRTKMDSPSFDASYYVNTFIRQYENWDLHDKEEGIVEPIFRNKLFGVYVPLRCEDEKRESSFLFDEFVQRWLADAERHNLVLLGEYGSGKTSSCLALCYRLLLQYRDRNDSILPIYLNFRNISLADESESPEKKIFTILSEKYQIKMGVFSESDFKSTLREHKLLLILDGLDEIVNSLETEEIKYQFSRLKHILLHCHKVIITCRTNYFRSEADVKYVFPLSSENVELLDNIVGSSNFEFLYLADFGEKQQEKYLQNSIKDEQRRAQILATIRETANLSDLARRPILLSMIVTFDDLLRKRTDIITQTTLYHEYTLYWLRRDFADRSRRIGIPDISVQERLFVLERLALNLFEKGTEQIHHDDLVYFLSKAFEGRNMNPSLIKQIEFEFAINSFLIRTKDKYFGFAHRSFLEFFVARTLRQDILANKPESLRPATFVWACRRFSY